MLYVRIQLYRCTIYADFQHLNLVCTAKHLKPKSSRQGTCSHCCASTKDTTVCHIPGIDMAKSLAQNRSFCSSHLNSDIVIAHRKTWIFQLNANGLKTWIQR